MNNCAVKAMFHDIENYCCSDFVEVAEFSNKALASGSTHLPQKTPAAIRRRK